MRRIYIPRPRPCRPIRVRRIVARPKRAITVRIGKNRYKTIWV